MKTLGTAPVSKMYLVHAVASGLALMLDVMQPLETVSSEQAGLGSFDVFALGVVLCELLTGGLLFTRKRRHQAGKLEMQRVIREQEPSKPSTKVTTLGDRAVG